jgi:hypothetical protein
MSTNLQIDISKIPNPLLNAEKETKELSPEQKLFRDTVADWLNIYPWLKVWTVTFDRMEQRMSQNYTKTGHWKGAPQQVGISERNAKRYFESWMRKHYPEYSWFYCVEPNPGRDGHHLHALIIPPLGVKCSHAQMGVAWWDRYGWNKVEDIKSNDDVTLYCTKHVVRYLNKGGGWYNLEINDSEIYHGRKRKTREGVKDS